MSKPRILLEGQPLEEIRTTFPIGTYKNASRHAPLVVRSETLPTIDPNDPTEPRKLLRTFSIAKTEHNEFGFWSLALLRCVLSRERIMHKLRQYGNDVCTHIDSIRPEEDSIQHSGAKTYLRVFALLLLLERESEIGNFIRDRVCDESLPLRYCQGADDLEFSHNTHPLEPLTCFGNWRTSEKEWFASHQWRVIVPYFKLDHEGRAENYKFDDKTILPWLPWNEGDSATTSSQPSKGEGGYADVFKIRIDPSSHGFHEVLKSVSSCSVPIYTR
jgi:hypothetical protein